MQSLVVISELASNLGTVLLVSTSAPTGRFLMPYYVHTNQGQHMRLLTSATQIDFYPVGTGKRFVKRVIWHPDAEVSQQMTSFTTRVKTDAIYDMNQYIANGAEVIDYNTEAYTGSDYSPVYC